MGNIYFRLLSTKERWGERTRMFRLFGSKKERKDGPPSPEGQTFVENWEVDIYIDKNWELSSLIIFRSWRFWPRGEGGTRGVHRAGPQVVVCDQGVGWGCTAWQSLVFVGAQKVSPLISTLASINAMVECSPSQQHVKSTLHVAF